jgi:hypothetical protein
MFNASTGLSFYILVHKGKKLCMLHFLWSYDLWRVIYLYKIQAALVKDPGVSVNRVIWSPDGSLFGKLGPY